MTNLKVYENLCIYDDRNPMYVVNDIEPQGRSENCSCDNCFYGKDELALIIVDLWHELDNYR